MSEPLHTLRSTAKKNKKDLPSSRSLLHYGNTPAGTVNSGRLSFMSNARLQKVTSNSLEKLSFISEKDENNDFENYTLEYSKYLLRKAQSRIILKNKEEKEENVKKCFLSLKWELEELLDKYVKLSKEIVYFKVFFDILEETNQKIEDGRKVLNVLKGNHFEGLMKSLSDSLDQTICQLQLVDFDKTLIENAFDEKIWGSGSEIDECLRKINFSINKNKDEISKIAAELVEIKKLSLENAALRKRFHSVFEKISNELLEANYKAFTSIVKKAFNEREECKSEFIPQSLDCDIEFLCSGFKPSDIEQQSLQISGLGSPLTPKSASTPQPN